MATVEVVVSKAGAEKMLSRAAEELAGNGELAKECLSAMGMLALEYERQRFIEHSAAADPFWPDLGPATVILRRGGPMIYSEADIAAKRAGIKKLRDTNRLLDSLSRGATGNVFRLGKLEVTVGTRDQRAKALHSGGTTRFDFNDEAAANFKRNVPKTKSGSAGAGEIYAEATGTHGDKRGRRQWKKHGLQSPWNPLYFFWRAVFTKWTREGKALRVPARPIIVPADARLVDKLVRTVRHFVAKATGGSASGGGATGGSAPGGQE